MTGDMTAVIAPRSDQLNAEDLIAGTKTIKITSVDVKVGAKEQPVTVHYEGENGKPFKPCKTVCKIMARVWQSEDSKTYVGKSMVLFRDPKVRFGADETGGIRVSHMSHIDKITKVTVLKTKGKYDTHAIAPIPGGEKKAERASEEPAPDAPAFDFEEFEGIVNLAIANMGADFPTWWEEQKPLRLQARDADKKRAGEIATRANEFIESLKEAY